MKERTTPSKPGRRVPAAVLALAPWALTAVATAAWWTSRKPPPEPPLSILEEEPEPPPGLSQAAVDEPEHFDEREPGRGRLAEWPHQIPPLGWKDILWRTYREVGRDRLPAVAGGITFYSLLSIFPALGVFVSLYGLIADVGAVQHQLLQLSAVFPADVVRILGEQMMRLATERGANLSFAFLLSLVLSIWTATASLKTLFDGLNVAYHQEEKRNFFLRTALTYSATFGFLAFITLVVAILVAAPIALRAMELRAEVLIALRWLVLYFVVAGALLLLYRYGPCRRPAKWRWVATGAVAAAFIWIAGSAAFSWYINNVAHLQVTYGSLGAVIGFMLWVWFSIMVVLVGAELNAETEHQTAVDTTRGPPKPMGTRGATMADSVGLRFVGFRRGAGILWGDTRRQVGNFVRRPRRTPEGDVIVTPALPPEPQDARPDPRRSAGR